MGKRRDARTQVENRIVELGRRHLATHGAAGLSLRAIARDLGMVSSAVYRYVANRDELLTLLVIDGYTELADTVEAARGTDGDWRADILAMARAARGWALAHPPGWALLYGSPVPGYHAPAERTVGPGTRVIGALLTAVSRGIASGEVVGAGDPPPAPLRDDFAAVREEFGFAGADVTLGRCFTLWATLIGAISLEVFGQYGADTLTDPGALFDLQVRTVLEVLDR